ncbi:MAG: hypothetical protein JNN08_17430 [Bryobacterales bacterium]|nr:hypothetical protein [Bryobacterales bacterium]
MSHTGEQIRIVGRGDKGRMGLFAMDPRSGAFKLIGQPGETAKSGKVRVVQRQPEGLRTVERDLKSGQETILVPEKSGTFRNQGARSSPDWNWLVWRSIDTRGAGEIRLMSVPATGGEPVTLAVAKRPTEITTHMLTPDSKYVLHGRKRQR